MRFDIVDLMFPRKPNVGGNKTSKAAANSNKLPASSNHNAPSETWTIASVVMNSILAVIAIVVSIVSLRSSNTAVTHAEENQSAIVIALPSPVPGKQVFLIKNLGGPAMNVRVQCVAAISLWKPQSFPAPQTIAQILPKDGVQMSLTPDVCRRDPADAVDKVTNIYFYIKYTLPWGDDERRDYLYARAPEGGWTSISQATPRTAYADAIEQSFQNEPLVNENW